MAKRKTSPSRRGHHKVPSGGKYWIFGTHAALAALANPKRQVVERRVTRNFLEAHSTAPGVADATIVDRRELETTLPEGAVHQGIAVLCAPLADIGLHDVLANTDPHSRVCIAVLDQATDPRNIGAVLRSAAAFGVSALVVQDRNAPPETGAMAKAASGALEHVPLVRVTNLARALEELKVAGFWCVGLDGGAETTLSETRLDGPTAFVFGAEGRGLRRLTRETCDTLCRIPLSKRVESLNLANAVSISLYEWTR